MVISIGVPLHSHRCPGQEGDPVPLPGAVAGGEDSPDAQPRERAKIPWTKVLLAHQRERKVAEGPGAYIDLEASVPPSVLGNESDEADTSEAQPYPELFRPLGMKFRRRPQGRDEEEQG